MTALAKSFFQIQNIFRLNPGPLSLKFSLILLSFFGVFFVLAWISKFLQSKNMKDRLIYNFYEKLFIYFLSLSIIGFVYTWFCYEGAYLLSMRLWLILSVLVYCVWFAYIMRYRFNIIPNIRKERKEKKKLENYLS